MNTKTECYYPIFGCLDEFEKRTHTDKWLCQNDRQFDIIEAKKSINLELIPELESISSKDVEVINQFLADRGFNIRLAPDLPGFAAASVLNVKTAWKYEGRETEFIKNDVVFDAFSMEKGFTFYKNGIIEIMTEGSDRLFISMQSDVPEKLDIWISQQDVENREWVSVNKIIIPKVKYNEQVNISWLSGLRNNIGDWISQALQETRFNMDEKGTHLESAVAMYLCTGSMMVEEIIYTVDEPFVLWITRPGLETPLLAAYFDTDVWEKSQDDSRRL